MTDYGRSPTRHDTDVIGKRVGAQIIDLFTVGFLSFTAIFLLSLVGTVASGPESGLADALTSIGFLIATGMLIGYSFLLETYWNGQTVGKRLLGIRVVKENGEELEGGSAFIRNLPGLVSLSWVAYLVALLSMASSDMRQRVFDRLAGTVVVTEQPENNSQPQQGQQQNRQQQQAPPQQ